MKIEKNVFIRKPTLKISTTFDPFEKNMMFLKFSMLQFTIKNKFK